MSFEWWVDDGTQMTLSGRMNADFFYFFVVQDSIVILNAVKNLKSASVCLQILR